MLDILRNKPDPESIEECILSVDSASQVESLRLVSLLLQYTIPEVFRELPSSTREDIIILFRTALGLGNLVGRIAMCIRSKPSAANEQTLLAYLDLLEHVFLAELVYTALKVDPSRKAIYTRELEKLLFRGKAFSVIGELSLVYPNIQVPAVFRHMDAYSRYLAKELLFLDDPTPFVSPLFSLGSGLLNQFIDVMFTPENTPNLITMRSSLKRYERKAFIAKFFDYSTTLIPKDSIHKEKIIALYQLSSQFLDGSVWDELTIENLLARCDYSLNLLAALLIDDSMGMSRILIRSWGNKNLMENEPIPMQQFRTHLLACVCSQLSKDSLKSMLRSPEFLTAMSNRLQSFSNKVKALGIVFADELSRASEEKTIFSIDVSDEISIPAVRILKSESTGVADEAWAKLQQPIISEVASVEMGEVQALMKPMKLADSVAENLSDDEDDPTMATSSKKVSNPIYIRDILSYLSVDTKDPQAYEKRKIALQTAPRLLIQRKGFGSEVAFYAESLLTQLTALTNFYEEDDFEAQRLNAMIAVVESSPQSTTHICHLLLTGDYSLQQRMCLLSTMVLSARELRGFKRDGLVRKEPQFPTKMLPNRLHSMYVSIDDETSRVQQLIQDEVMSEPAEEAKDQLAGGKILRISSGLKRKAQNNDLLISKDQLRAYGSIVGKNFFFPLVAVWYESGGIDIGHYSPILIGHFIKSLSLILHSAFPIAAEINDMVREFLGIVVPVLQGTTADQLQIIESSVTGLMVVLDVVDDSILVSNFDHMVSAAANSIQQCFELIIDDRIKSLCAGFLYRVATLRQTLERSLMDQMNGSFYS